jgi:hypothetical protein
MDNLPLPKASKPTSENEKRFIYFVPEGIVITDQNRSAIDAHIIDQRSRQLGFKAPPVYPTLPLALIALSLQSHPFGRDFLNLWEHRSGTTVDAVLNGAGALSRASKKMKAIPRDYFTSGVARALPLCTTYSGSAETAVWNLLPIYPGDALWLIHRFLEPMADSSDVPTRPRIQQETLSSPNLRRKSFALRARPALILPRFLQSPIYVQHPFIDELRLLPELARREGANLRKATSTIKSALDVLRGQSQPCVTRTVRVVNPAGGQKLNISLTQLWIHAAVRDNLLAPVDTPSIPIPPTRPAAPNDEGELQEMDTDGEANLEDETELLWDDEEAVHAEMAAIEAAA